MMETHTRTPAAWIRLPLSPEQHCTPAAWMMLVNFGFPFPILLPARANSTEYYWESSRERRRPEPATAGARLLWMAFSIWLGEQEQSSS